ncbi:hypothetical protein H072_11320 [Dactylellina haptotyla CBS 200.50]|uniref:Cyanovirin-N domain-containing protein n=1 Tax=Dactylellina haptotyla (strain CBS 200.50) TaxID=1284197 RepID=S8A2G8_DACHA|nr:hypothetical protein H072_11320 [Dactylellina haptotyla CBS 200.50]
MVKLSLSVFSLLTAATLVAAVPTPNEIFKRDVTCRDDLGPGALANVNEAVECINYLASLGGQACVATVSGQSFCRRGQTQITGLSRLGGGQNAISSCNDVARGAGQILDRCTRGDGTVRGANEAWGNGNLLVDIRRVP